MTGPPSSAVRSLLTLVATAALWGATPRPTPAQTQAGEAWNDARAMELVRRARLERRSTLVDTAFQSYQSQARGFVYFFIDRPGSDERTLVKTDQIALEVFWRAPDRIQQRIVGLRDQKVLPTNISYHLDHLTVVQDDFGDRIRLGDGDEVESVLHPMAPGGPDVYDYLLADSLTLRYGGQDEEVRVYELRVRPKNPDEPGFVGSVFVDRAAAAIVRMSFTFTPASYVDPYLDYIRISLDNALWMGRYWLPYRQEAELRRELPQLDFLAGSIIRGRFEVGGYDFNVPIPPATFVGTGVTAVPREQREAFPFERGLFDDLEERGLAPAPSLEEVRAQAQQLLAGRALSGLSSRRLHIRSFSDALRVTRAEGLFLGGGVNVRPDPEAVVRLSGGYAFAREAATLAAGVTVAHPERVVPVLHLFWDEPRDMGTVPGTAPAISTLGALLVGEDWLDTYFTRGVRLTLRGPLPHAGPELTMRWERHASADRADGDFDRPLLPVQEGVLGAVEGRLPFALPAAGTASLTATFGRMGDHAFGSAVLAGAWRRDTPGRVWRLTADGALGLATGDAPAQELFLLGGRGTLPGYDFRTFAGHRFWMARLEATRTIVSPWLGIRGFAAVGATDLADSGAPAPWAPGSPWAAADSDGLRASVGLGLSLGWDVLRLDVARGVRDGRWEIIFGVDPRLHPWL